MVTFNYIKTKTGDYAVQVVDDYGFFAILTRDSTYPQGHGWVTDWVIVDPKDVPMEIKEGLDKAIEDFLDYNAYLECLLCEGSEHEWYINNN